MRRSLPSLLALALVAATCTQAAGGDVEPGPLSSGSETTAETVFPNPDPVTTITSILAPDPSSVPPIALASVQVAVGLDRPVFAIAPPGDRRLFIVEQPGRVRILSDDRLLDEPFLDITDLVGSEGLEQGLLGLAFHPDFPDDDRFFVNYTDRDGDTRVVSYRLAGDADTADPASRVELLAVPQPATNHNGGMLQFGTDGYLYVSLGDGGGGDDQFGNGQRPDTLLGAILRLDVDAGAPYAIPPDNPFVAGGGAPEVWAYGLRNPWRFDIDPATGLMYVADVGQAEWEEVTVVDTEVAGLNFGWSILEGEECFAAAPCSTAGLQPPVLTYDHSQGCSITGGFVYRGELIPELDGQYFFSDWCGGWLRSFRFEGGEVTDLFDWTAGVGDLGRVVSFGRDGAGELYVLNGDGVVTRIVAQP